MLSKVLKFYLFASVFFMMIFINDFAENYLPIYLYQFFIVLGLGIFYYKKWLTLSNNPSSISLTFEVGVISLIIITLNNVISYQYTENTFVFSEADASTYDWLARSFINANTGLSDVLNRLGYGKLGYDDYGQIYLLSALYMIWDNNLMLNIYYWVIGIVSAKYLFKLCLNFMSKKYAYMASLIFFTSSFFLWFNSSGLKESQMIFLIIMSFYFYYEFYKKRTIKYLLISLFFLFMLSFFRPAVSFLILFSMGGGYVLAQKLSGFKIVMVTTFLILLVGLISVIEEQKNKFVTANYSETINIKEADGMIRGGVAFTLTVNTLSALIGHFPSINPEAKTMLSFFYPGLLLKCLLSIFYVVALIMLIKHKYYSLLPVALFPLFESASLVYIFEALELRKSLPHYPLLYVLIFWAIYQIDSSKKNWFNNSFAKQLYALYFIMSIFIIIYWNLR
jgi:hypothetical protein